MHIYTDYWSRERKSVLCNHHKCFMHILKIHPGVHVRLSEIVDNSLGAKERVASTIVDYKLESAAARKTRPSLMVIVKDGMHNIRTVKRKECVMSHHDGKMYWKSPFL